MYINSCPPMLRTCMTLWQMLVTRAALSLSTAFTACPGRLGFCNLVMEYSQSLLLLTQCGSCFGTVKKSEHCLCLKLLSVHPWGLVTAYTHAPPTPWTSVSVSPPSCLPPPTPLSPPSTPLSPPPLPRPNTARQAAAAHAKVTHRAISALAEEL